MPWLMHTLSYRLIPTFGRDTIRRFSNNVSEMKKLAARDFEDMLQVAVVLDSLCVVLTGVSVVCYACLRRLISPAS
jgi:hypothetical protein